MEKDNIKRSKAAQARERGKYLLLFRMRSGVAGRGHGYRFGSQFELGDSTQGGFPSLKVRRRFPAEFSGRNQRANLLARYDAADIARLVHIEDDHGQIVVLTEAHCGGIHDL